MNHYFPAVIRNERIPLEEQTEPEIQTLEFKLKALLPAYRRLETLMSRLVWTDRAKKKIKARTTARSHLAARERCWHFGLVST